MGYNEEEVKDVVIKDGVYCCPKCGSKKIIVFLQCAVDKVEDANSGKLLNPKTLKVGMTQREKAHEYDCATTDGVGCWTYQCRKCSWTSDVYTE